MLLAIHSRQQSRDLDIWNHNTVFHPCVHDSFKEDFYAPLNYPYKTWKHKNITYECDSTCLIKKSSSFPFRLFTDCHSTIIFPWWIMLIVSQILSTSARIWVLKKIVVPESRSETSKSFTIFRPIGSSPLMGSSRNNNSGSLMIDCASPTLWSIHFEYVLRYLSPASSSHTRFNKISIFESNSSQENQKKLPLKCKNSLPVRCL